MFGSVAIVYTTGPVQIRQTEIDRETSLLCWKYIIKVQTSAGKKEYDRCWCTGFKLIVCTAANTQLKADLLKCKSAGYWQKAEIAQFCNAMFASNLPVKLLFLETFIWSVLQLYTAYRIYILMEHRWGEVDTSVFNVFPLFTFVLICILSLNGNKITFVGLFIPLMTCHCSEKVLLLSKQTDLRSVPGENYPYLLKVCSPWLPLNRIVLFTTIWPRPQGAVREKYSAWLQFSKTTKRFRTVCIPTVTNSL